MLHELHVSHLHLHRRPAVAELAEPNRLEELIRPIAEMQVRLLAIAKRDRANRASQKLREAQ